MHCLTNGHEEHCYVNATHFQPRHGRCPLTQLRSRKKYYNVLIWDVITRDYNQSLTPEQVVNIVQRYTRNGSVIVFHDSIKAQNNVLNALEPSIQWLIEQGYTFKLINEVI